MNERPSFTTDTAATTRLVMARCEACGHAQVIERTLATQQCTQCKREIKTALAYEGER